MLLNTIEEILEQLYKLFDDGKIKEAEIFLNECVDAAKEKHDKSLLLQLYNEFIGYYRELSDWDKMLEAIEHALEMANELALSGTMPYATTILNAANGFRAFGKLDKSKEFYAIAEEIYRANLSEKDMLFASLYNNMSLLYQECSDYAQAEEFLLKALAIVEFHEADFEIAVTYANLANTLVMVTDYSRAKNYANQAITMFTKMEVLDAHYCAAISALAMCYFYEKLYEKAAEKFEAAMHIVYELFGHNSQYDRLKENYDMCVSKMAESDAKGMDICRDYYVTYGAPMIHEKFADYEDKIAVGLVGEGSDCFMFDDAISKDHDFGPSFCMWLDDETYEQIGNALQKEYDELPSTFRGEKRTISKAGINRRGVHRISDFYKRILGEDNYPNIQWTTVEDYALKTASNGEVFKDEQGLFSGFRSELLSGYPDHIRFLKLAQAVALVCQSGQYNYRRMYKRKDTLTADIMLVEFMKNAMKLQHYICNIYPPHDKWLLHSTELLPNGNILVSHLKDLYKYLNCADNSMHDKANELIETICSFLAKELYDCSDISDVESYLDVHVEELNVKAYYASFSIEKLATEIAKIEFKAFDLVKNEGGRASCQNDWPTFSVMRRSQYLTWNKTMLLQYIYDFKRELSYGHNLITEKYGRMMESTAPKQYEQMKQHFPFISEEKKAIIEQIVAIQMTMVEEFASVHPKVAVNARSLHTYEDNIINTSYETYLRGEISTYSDKMLQLYASYVVACYKSQKNIARMTIENTAKLYGYANIEEFENTIQ